MTYTLTVPAALLALVLVATSFMPAMDGAPSMGIDLPAMATMIGM